MNKTTNETVQSMQHLDSLKAVKVAMDMNKAQDKTIDMLVNLVASMDKNMKLLATKVLELEQKLNNTEKALDLYETDLTKLDKKVEGLEAYANREI
jgi:peptidoglycan hydrolase CwlO-like protein